MTITLNAEQRNLIKTIAQRIVITGYTADELASRVPHWLTCDTFKDLDGDGLTQVLWTEVSEQFTVRIIDVHRIIRSP